MNHQRIALRNNGARILNCWTGKFQSLSTKRIPSKWSKNNDGEKWIGVFSCDEIRTVDYKCHKHSFIGECIPSP